MKYPAKFAALITCIAALSSLSGYAGETRSLKFYHTHTDKSLQVTYYRQGHYDSEALTEIRQFLADWRDGQQHEINPDLMDLLWKLQQVTGSNETWEVISAYRSPETNELLRKKSTGVAKKSQHLLGNAIDIRLRNIELQELRDAAINLKLGGVGYYPQSNFVHVDTGRVRYW